MTDGASDSMTPGGRVTERPGDGGIAGRGVSEKPGDGGIADRRGAEGPGDAVPAGAHAAAPVHVITSEAAELMDRLIEVYNVLADGSEQAARIQARLTGPAWPIEVREVEVARYLAHANEARRRARDLVARRAGSVVVP